MERQYSNIEPEKLIYSLLRLDELCDRRIDLSPDEEAIQVCGRAMSKGQVVPAHRHLPQDRRTTNTQESWVVLKGSVRARFFDLDSSFLCERDIHAGDVVAFYRGGHSLKVLEDNTLFYEFKNGPYNGVKQDKEPIND